MPDAYRKAMRLARPFFHPWVTLNPAELATSNRKDIDVRVECLRWILEKATPLHETDYYQFAADQDKGFVANPDLAVENLLKRHADSARSRRFPTGEVAVVETPDPDARFQIAAGEDALAAAIYQNRTRITCRLLHFNPCSKFPNYTDIISKKAAFYRRCCGNADLRALLDNIRAIHYGALYERGADKTVLRLDAEGNPTNDAANFHRGARVVELTRNFYQGLEEIGIVGERPSEIRFREYGLGDFLKGTERVLDLGCNVGFFSLYLARHTNFVRGIEANRDLIRIGNLVGSYLGIANCELLCGFYDGLDKNEKYDLILSCNFHYYLNLPVSQFLHEVLLMLKPKGLLLMETSTPIKPDASPADFSFLNNLAIPEVDSLVRDGGLRILRQGLAASNVVCIRCFGILQKET